MFKFFRVAVERLMAAQMDINRIVALAILMFALVACVVASVAVNQAQADVRPLAWLCGASITLVVIAAVGSRR